ncbi:MAG: FAD-dependent oxidoreductase [Oligoflexus sp.]
MKSYDILIVGGGTAGMSTAAHLRANFPQRELSIGIIEPSAKHYYQPLWTVAGAGVVKKEITERRTQDCLPPACTWIQEKAANFYPEDSQLELASQERIAYKYLIVAAGIQLDWDKVEGLQTTIGKNRVTSNYSYETVDYTWQCIQETRDGNAIFTQPAMPIKCAGAPQKICYLAEDYFRKHRLRDQIDVRFCSVGPAIFGVPKYRAALEKVVERKKISTYFEHELIKVDGEAKRAYFRKVSDGEEVVMPFSMLHVTPPMSSPDFIKQSPLADQAGWVEVDKHSLQHLRYPNVFSLGDVSSLPCAKTGAAIRKQVPVLVKNLLSYIDHDELKAHYNGYGSCPLVTGYGSVIFAEFDYDGPDETFPFDQAEERFSMYMLKVYGLPKLYWHGMLKGKA